MRGLRVHLTGSAAKGCDGALLRTAHTFVEALVKEVVANGGGLVVGAGSEPQGDCGEPCIFDWTALLGGGAGTEHLAERYRDEGKPVVPIHAELGALNDDGNGGSRFLHERALAGPDPFFRLRDSAGSAAGRLSSLRLRQDADSKTLAE